MTTKKPDNNSGMRGQCAGQTVICTVGHTGAGLTYRGYDMVELADKARFEEVAYLLLHGKLPNQQELVNYIQKLKGLRNLPASLKAVLEKIPADTHPMDVMRTGCSMLGNLEVEASFAEQYDKTDRMLAVFPSIINYWYRYSRYGVRIETETDDDSIGGHFLHLLRDEVPTELHARVMNVSLILYAEHEFNASTFAARVCASTLSDIHSCVTAAIGTLRGPLHGGANEAAMAMLQQWHSPDEAEQAILGMLARKEKIMGFGHAVYKESDPRNAVIKAWSGKLAEDVGDDVLYPVSLRCEEVMWREKKLFCNADFFHASAYHFMGIPTELFTPIFVCSRVTGWCAHIFEQRANNRLIRPTAEYIGPESASWIPIEERE